MTLGTVLAKAGFQTLGSRIQFSPERVGPSMRGWVALGLCLTLALANGCAPLRGTVSIDPAAEGLGTPREILVASVRAPTDGAGLYGSGRAPLSLSDFVVSVPPIREPGSLTWPRKHTDPRTDFVTLAATPLSGERAFVSALNRQLDETGYRETIVFVHGYNTNFAEGLYRQAQLAHDFALPAVSVNFAWPSAAAWDRYPYDKESAIFASDGLARSLDLIVRSKTDRLVVSCHSMGCFLATEAIWAMSLRGDEAFFDRLSAVVMLAPDIDLDLFRSRLQSMSSHAIPIFVFASEKDRALRASARLHSRRARVGSITDPTAFADLPVTLIDVTAVKGNDAHGHSTVQNSPLLIALFNGVDALGVSTISNAVADPSHFETSIRAVGKATRIVLQPITPY